jgi:uncharacterized protein
VPGRQLLYMDASALVKRLKLETESPALDAYLSQARAAECVQVTSELAFTEVPRALWRAGPSTLAEARGLLEQLETIPLTRAILDRAATLLPGERIRSLDALHLASALGLGDELRALVSYDTRMLQAAAHLSLTVSSPS